jgi:hypothetical protein
MINENTIRLVFDNGNKEISKQPKVQKNTYLIYFKPLIG